MDAERRAEVVKEWAREAGFDRAGVATLEAGEHGEIFLRWLDRGDHAGMEWMTRRVETRLDPRRVLDGAHSVLCVALRYHPLQPGDEPGGDLWPRVARYARGIDYHDLMEARLVAVAERVREHFPGCPVKTYVDTGPVLERELAARAGLGVFGKNTNLLCREHGSWFLLGELFLGLDLAPDPPVADLCGSCTLCLEACPTGALPAPYRLDANHCISYWTIEHRGVVPLGMRAGLQGWVFGCDVCQEVCPWNRRRQEPVRHPELALPAERRELDLVALLGMGREVYVERFRGSPMKRAKREGLQRNAALAMGNRGEPRYVPALVAALETGTPVVRGAAAWALGKIGGERAEAALRERLVREHPGPVREEVQTALAETSRASLDPGSASG
jgi:epoxyqueuosine reductase